ncbi:conserved hypothetical protein [Bradyrhizobium sp. ORS 375]|nr:conserved hypothetical protein [Bradyrhizobium sp. ORS 375]
MSSRPMSSVQLPSLRISFLHITFALAFALVGCGIVALPLDWPLRGGSGAGLVALVWSSFTLAETMSLLSRNLARGRRQSPVGRRA